VNDIDHAVAAQARQFARVGGLAWRRPARSFACRVGGSSVQARPAGESDVLLALDHLGQLRLHQSPPPLDEPESTSPPPQPSPAPMSTGRSSSSHGLPNRRPIDRRRSPQAGRNIAGDRRADPKHAAAARRGCSRVAADQVIDETAISPALRASIDDLAKIRSTGRSQLMKHASEEQKRKATAPQGSPTGRTTPVSRVFSTKHNFAIKIDLAAHQEIVKEDSKCHFHFMIL
jgi:hypothetical protein